MSGRLDPPKMPRRDFLGLSGLIASGLAVSGSLIGMARLAKPAVTPEVSSSFRVGRAKDFPAGTRKVISEYQVEIISTEAGLAALSLICTHLGCVAKKQESNYLCPCHGSLFGKEGEVLAGPAPQGLKWFALSQAADGSIIVDSSREVPVGHFTMIV